MDFFSVETPMRGLQGDTFPPFYVIVNDMDTAECDMRIVLEPKYTPGEASFVKDCDHFTRYDGAKGFRVQLGSAETAGLSGTYTMHFIMTDEDEREYRKLVGTLEVLPVPTEVV